ncbi:MAG: YraN family protein [candidate division WOR-3 bacterium]
MNRSRLGAAGEQIAEQYLKSRGWRVLERNYRTKLGEIDLVCREKGTIVFVEVKTRTSSLYGEGTEAVNYSKQRKLYRLAQEYLGSHRLESADVRFDVLSIMFVSGQPTIKHIPGAF